VTKVWASGKYKGCVRGGRYTRRTSGRFATNRVYQKWGEEVCEQKQKERL